MICNLKKINNYNYEIIKIRDLITKIEKFLGQIIIFKEIRGQNQKKIKFMDHNAIK